MVFSTQKNWSIFLKFKSKSTPLLPLQEKTCDDEAARKSRNFGRKSWQSKKPVESAGFQKRGIILVQIRNQRIRSYQCYRQIIKRNPVHSYPQDHHRRINPTKCDWPDLKTGPQRLLYRRIHVSDWIEGRKCSWNLCIVKKNWVTLIFLIRSTLQRLLADFWFWINFDEQSRHCLPDLWLRIFQAAVRDANRKEPSWFCLEVPRQATLTWKFTCLCSTTYRLFHHSCSFWELPGLPWFQKSCLSSQPLTTGNLRGH